MPSVRISTGSHGVRVIAEARDAVSVDGAARVRLDGEQTTIDEVSGRLIVRVPPESELVIGTGSGRVVVGGPAGDVRVTAESGRVEVEQARSVDARVTSGRVVIGRVTGLCRVRSESGRIEIAECGGADAATNSGRIVLTHVAGPVRAHCVSGRVTVGLDTAHDVDAETVTGRIDISLPPATRAHRVDGSGSLARPDAYDCTVRAVSVNGRIGVTNR
jgi:DUF4097 and DUF4098 domain-containing protein YvlB